MIGFGRGGEGEGGGGREDELYTVQNEVRAQGGNNAIR